MSGLAKTIFNAVAKKYQAVVAGRVAAVGLKYDDLLVETPDMMTALHRIDNKTLLERERRIKRAFDVSAKKKTIPDQYQPENPLEPYLSNKVDQAKLERQEREIINGY